MHRKSSEVSFMRLRLLRNCHVIKANNLISCPTTRGHLMMGYTWKDFHNANHDALLGGMYTYPGYVRSTYITTKGGYQIKLIRCKRHDGTYPPVKDEE